MTSFGKFQFDIRTLFCHSSIELSLMKAFFGKKSEKGDEHKYSQNEFDIYKYHMKVLQSMRS